MSTSEQDTMSQHHDSLWETVSKVVDELQNSFYRNSSQLNSSSELVQKLLEIKELPCLIPKEELSIVYCEYGTQNYELIVYAGQVVDGSPPTGAFNPKNQNIKNVAEKSLEQQDYPWFQTKDKCKEAGFGGFGTVMIVPMRLGRDRRLGAFIIHSTQENAYGEPLQRVLDVLSDRLASLIRSLRRELRDRVAYDLRNHLLEQLTSRKPDNVFNKECEVLDAVLSRLREWFKDKNERIYILIHNPLDEKTYHQATNQQGREIQSDFRSLPVLAHQELLQIVGGEENLSKLTTLNNALHGIRVDDASQLPSIREGCQSLLGVTMHYPNGDVLGHVVLHDTGMTHAYDHDDLRFMDAMADFLGLVLAEFRTKQKEKAIHAIESHPAEDTTELHAIVADYLHRLYGIRSFQIWAIETSSQRWEPWAAGLGNGLSLGEDEQFQNAVARFANEYRKWEGYTNKSLKFSWKGANYLVTPMRAGNQTEDWRVIGAFIIPSNNPGSIASNKIDEVSDALGKRLKSQHNQQRYKALTEFVNTVSSLASSNLTQEQVLKIAYEHIQQVMFSANVYIALYDETENSISFPLIYRHGKVWEEMHNATRKIDPTQLGRTEVIIRDKQPLLIKTLEESKAWYKTPGHKDHAGNPLASWVGVPIFSASEGKEKKVRGVIAAYHDGLDYVYSIRDVFFLQNVAGAVAGLFRILDLKEANRKLEEAKLELEETSIELDELQDKNRALSLMEMNDPVKEFLNTAMYAVKNSIFGIQRAIELQDIGILDARNVLGRQETAFESMKKFKESLQSLLENQTGGVRKIYFGKIFERLKQHMRDELKMKEISLDIAAIDASGEAYLIAKEQDVDFVFYALFSDSIRQTTNNSSILIDYLVKQEKGHLVLEIKIVLDIKKITIGNSIRAAKLFLKRKLQGSIAVNNNNENIVIVMSFPKKDTGINNTFATKPPFYVHEPAPG